MKRRHLLLGSTAVLSGAAFVARTGSFSQAEGQREARIAVEEDSDAYLGLVPDVDFGELYDVECEGTLRIGLRNQTQEDQISVSVDPTLSGSGVRLSDGSQRTETVGVGEREAVEFEPGCVPGTDSAKATMTFVFTATADGGDRTIVEAERVLGVECHCPPDTPTANESSS
jgi:hypothetical protein